jgi:hypothetical protein
MKIRGHPVDLMVDAGAEYSAVTQPVGSLSNEHITITWVTGDQVHHLFLMARQCNL